MSHLEVNVVFILHFSLSVNTIIQYDWRLKCRAALPTLTALIMMVVTVFFFSPDQDCQCFCVCINKKGYSVILCVNGGQSNVWIQMISFFFLWLHIFSHDSESKRIHFLEMLRILSVVSNCQGALKPDLLKLTYQKHEVFSLLLNTEISPQQTKQTQTSFLNPLDNLT